VRVFLGTRLECAQCHNHPFDKWKQKEFFEMSAFTGGISYRHQFVDSDDPGAKLLGMVREMKRDDKKMVAKAASKITQSLGYGIAGSGTGQTLLPHDYQYDDFTPGQRIRAKSMFGEDVPLEYAAEKKKPNPKASAKRRGLKVSAIDSRVDYAAWMTSPSNPRFTTVVANRLWKRLMGRGLIEPLDDMREDTAASNPALMEYLEGLMIELDYDLKQFQRVLLNTRTWQRVATQDEVPADATYRFGGPLLQRMSAEQIWDSMLTLVVPDLDSTLLGWGAKAESGYDNYEELLSISEEELRKQAQVRSLRYTDPDAYRKELTKLRQAQLEERAKAKSVLKEFLQAREAGDTRRVAKLSKQLTKMGVTIPESSPDRRKRGRGRGVPKGGLARASDLPSPAPAGHFLRRFGQSDREQIEASHRDANVPQALSLINGFVEENVITNRNAVMRVAIDEAETSKEKIRLAFLGVLSREPSSKETSSWLADFRKDEEQAVQDLVWTLVNTHEFRFIQ